jgi:type I restriction enzyme S subunit
MPAVDADQGAITTPQTRAFKDVRSGFTAFRDGDVIVAKITPCMENGKAAVCRGLKNGYGYGSTEFHVLRPTSAVLPEFIYHYVRQESFRREAAENMTGSVGQKRVPVNYMQSVHIPLPPLAEQKRIVAKLEELLARVNAARDRLAKLPTILKRFRQSVISAACSGRLTEQWREKQGTRTFAAQILTSIAAERRRCWLDSQTPRFVERHLVVPSNLASKYEEPKSIGDDDLPSLPDSWLWVRAEQVCEFITKGTTPQCTAMTPDGGEVPYTKKFFQNSGHGARVTTDNKTL